VNDCELSVIYPTVIVIDSDPIFAQEGTVNLIYWFVTELIRAFFEQIVTVTFLMSFGYPFPVIVTSIPPLFPPVEGDTNVAVRAVAGGTTPVVIWAIPTFAIETIGVIEPAVNIGVPSKLVGKAHSKAVIGVVVSTTQDRLWTVTDTSEEVNCKFVISLISIVNLLPVIEMLDT